MLAISFEKAGGLPIEELIDSVVLSHLQDRDAYDKKWEAIMAANRQGLSLVDAELI